MIESKRDKMSIMRGVREEQMMG